MFTSEHRKSKTLPSLSNLRQTDLRNDLWETQPRTGSGIQNPSLGLFTPIQVNFRRIAAL